MVEKYKVTDDLQIEQYEIIYEEFGIGMPSNAGENEEFIYEDGKYHIRNMKHQFESLNIRNGKVVSNHRLAWGRRTVMTRHAVKFLLTITLNLVTGIK